MLGLGTPASTLRKAEAAKHPLHLSSTELNYNTKSLTVEISCRIFTDDFEDLLGKKYKIKPDLSSVGRHREMDALVNKYMATHLQLAAAGKVVPLTYLGYENDKEAIVVYLESAEVKNIKSLEVSCTVLYDSFDDQTNIFHVSYNGNRKSSKLTYPDKKFVAQL
jgi:hypothetical protein